MSNLIIPYEISLWEDRLVAVDAAGNEYDDFIDTSITVDHQYYKEKKICIIGSHTMKTPMAAVEPKLVRKIDGTSTLTFSIYSKYYDETSGELLDNPFVKYLTNERKVKLKYYPKNDSQVEWLDLVIKKISETSENYKFSYTATDSFINELSKTGYNLVFDAELNNNTGSVNELAAAILEGTDWTVDETAGQLQETIEEPLYELVLNRDIIAWKIEDVNQTSSITIKAGSKIYPFYSCVKNSTADFYQFIYLDSADPLIDQDGILRNEECQYFMKTIPSGTATYFNEYRAERYARTAQIKYEKELERYVQGYKKDGVQKWGYTEDVTVSPTVVKNYLVNGEDFISTKGWRYNYPGLVETTTHPTIKQAPKAEKRLHLLKTALVPEDKAPDSGPQGLINSGIISNAYEIKNIAAGENYVFRIKVGSGLNTDINNPSLTGFEAALKFKFYIGEKTTNELTGKTTISDVGVLEQGFGIVPERFLNDNSYYVIVTFAKSYDEEALKKLFISLKPTEDSQYYIEFVQFFPYVEFIDDANTRFTCLPNGQMFMTESTDISDFPNDYVSLKTVYHYYHNDSDNDDKVVPEYEGGKNQNYIPVYVPNYGKVRSITAKESNRFNLLQDLSESFECWCKFTIEHEENGAIKLGDKHKPLKKVSFHAQVGQKKNIGFVYGKNLKSISRALDSDSIASKLIVKSNANKLAESGSCNIARAAQNPSGENFVYDFSHYIKQGLLNKYNVYNDLYDDNASKGYVGLFPQLKPKNLERDKLIQQSAILAGDYSEYKAQANADELLLEKSRDILFDLETEFVEETGKSFEALEINDPLLEKEEFLGIATSIFLYRQQVKDLKTKVDYSSNQLAMIEGQLKTLSEQLSTIETYTSNLINKFENKYSRFIQEASWTSEDYIDDNLYYIDAESTLHESAQPKVSYTINVVDISQLDEYKPYRFELGDITYIQDIDFFGWEPLESTGGIKTPYKEEIVVTELTTIFHEPDKATIKVQNYKNQFEDLFQRVAATTQQLKFHSGEYDRSADVVNGKGMVQPGALQEAFNHNAYVISNINNQSVEMGEQGIIIRNTRAPNEIIRLASGGIFLTEDAGETWTTGIMASGINAKVITTGTLNAALANITTGNGGGGVFIDENGITGKDADRREAFKLTNDGEFKVGNESNYIKFNENQNEKLEVKADSFSLASGGSIGGPNLLRNTAPIEEDHSSISHWSLNAGAINLIALTLNGKKSISFADNTDSTISQSTIMQTIRLEKNTTYTLSYQLAWLHEISENTKNIVAIYSGSTLLHQESFGKIESEEGNFQNISVTFTTADKDEYNNEVQIHIGVEPGEYRDTIFYLHHLKLEEGPVATAWDSNDSDTQARIDITNNAIISEVRRTANYTCNIRGYWEFADSKYLFNADIKNISSNISVSDICQTGVTLQGSFSQSLNFAEAFYLGIVTEDNPYPQDGNPVYLNGLPISRTNPLVCDAGTVMLLGFNEDHWDIVDNGAYSKITQTADSIRSEVSEIDGRLSTVEQTAEGITQTVSNLEGKVQFYGICNTDAAVALKVVDIVSGKEFFPEMTQDEYPQGIVLNVLFTNGNTVTTTPKISISHIEEDSGGEDIFQEDKNFLPTFAPNTAFNFIYDKTVSSNGAWIIQDNGSYSQIKQTADEISAKVVSKTSSGKGCSWAMTENGFYIAQGNKAITNNTISDYVMKVDGNGLEVKGKITAISGKIGGWNVGTFTDSNTNSYTNSLYSTSPFSDNTTDSSKKDGYRIFLRSVYENQGNVVFGIKKYTGFTPTSDGDIPTSASGQYTFYVDNKGLLYAQNANITGKITATSGGEIGGWVINKEQSYLRNGSGNIGTQNTIYLFGKPFSSSVQIGNSTGTNNWVITAGNTFGITNAGKLYATGADISGVITATGGDIGGLKINQSTPLSLIKTVRHSVNSSTVGTNYIKISNWNSTKTGTWYNYYYKILPGKSLTLQLSYSGTEVYTLSSLPTEASINLKRFDYQNLAAGTHTYSISADNSISYLLINQSGSTAPTVSYSNSKSPLVLTGSGAITEQTVMVSFIHTNTAGGGYGNGSVTPEMSFDFSSYGPIEVVSTYPAATDDTASISTSTSGKKITVTSAGHFGPSGSTGPISLKVYLKYSYNMPSNSTLWNVNSDGSTEIKYLKVGTLINSQLEDLEKRVKALEAK